MTDETASLNPRPPLPPSAELTARLGSDLASLRQLPAEDRLDALLLDQRRRWRFAQMPSVEAYRQACPDLAGDDETTLLLITAEAMLRRQSGEAVTVEEYARRFPRHAEDLARQFQVEAALETALPDGNTQGTTITLDAPGGVRPAGLPFLESAGVPGFEILEELGKGGMGVVYKARQLGLDRVVALKMILAGAHASATARERFLREGQAVAKLKHPHIVPVFQLGEHAGQLYFALEYVPGGSLARKLDGKPWPARKAAELVATLAGAVQHAHERNIIHRDLKPANVLLDEHGRPHVTDFGLARQAEAAGLTCDGAVLGTPAYMAPEQAAGRAEGVGPQADVFGLGAILYQLLAGRPPFQGPDVRTTLRQAEQGKVLPVRDLNPQVPAALARVCDRALAADPTQRYASAAQLERDLRRYLAWGRRLRTWAAAGGAALMLLAGCVFLWGGAGAPWHADRSRQHAGDGDKTGQQPPVPPPLTGDLTVRLANPALVEFTPVDRPGVLPARTGDLVRLEVELNRPAYVYLFWLDAKEVAALYPWDHETQSLDDPPPPQKPRKSLTSPRGEAGPGKVKAHRIEGEGGLETALLLARSTPLPAEVDLRKLIRPLPQPQYQSEQEYAVRGFDAGRPAGEVHQQRKLAKKAAEVDEPLLALLGRLKDHFEVVRAVRFAHKRR